MCAATSETLRFSSTMTRIFSTLVAGDAECEPGSGEPDGGAGTGCAFGPEHALTARSTTATATAAAASHRDRAHPITALPCLQLKHAPGVTYSFTLRTGSSKRCSACGETVKDSRAIASPLPPIRRNGVRIPLLGVAGA